MYGKRNRFEHRGDAGIGENGWKGKPMVNNFYRRMALVCGRIPEGTVATYGQIALLCGKPKNARQVGYGLRHNLAGEIPAHRVVNGQGKLSGAVYFDTPDMQKLLLEAEGVDVFWTSDGWKVDLKRFGWKNTMEDALELLREFEMDEDGPRKV